MELDMTSPTDTTFFRRKQFEIDIQANYELQSSLLHIPAGALRLQDATFNLSGSAHIAKESVIDFRINGDKPDLNLITAFLPESVKTSLEPFQYDGHIYFDGMVRGRVAKDQMPLIEVDFGCKDAWFLNTGANQKVDQLGFKGYYYNGSEHALSTSELHITNVNARPGKGIFKGNFVMRDFTNPQIVMQVNSNLELKFVGEFFGITDLKQTTGKIQLDMDFQEIMDIKLPEESLRKLKEGVQSRLIVENLSFVIPGHPLPVKNLNLQAEMRNGSITLDSASLKLGNSDLHVSGSLSDIQAFLRNHKKAVSLKLNARSKNLLLKDVFAYDTALQNKMTEEISAFKLGLEVKTTVEQLLNPAPLPKGQFDLKILNATLKNYKHSFKEISAELTVNDTLVRLKNLKGMVDNSDFEFSGRVTNYQLWFQDVMKGKTQIAFDFKSKRFALDDILGRGTRKFVPRGYRHEEANDVWLRTKIDLRYDTVFRFAKAHIANATGFIKNHNFLMKEISGTVKYGANRIFVLDTLKGTIGKSDFDITMRLFNGADKTIKKRTNYFYLKSNFLDVDELVSYNFAPDTTRRRRSDSTRSKRPRKPPVVVAAKDTSAHAKSFNIFTLPFNEFTLRVDVGKLKYNKLWMKELTARARMTQDHFIYADTLATRIAGGYVGINGVLDGRDTSKLLLTSTIMIDQLDLEKVMLKLDHFGQDLVVNKNVKGKLTGTIKSAVQVHPNFVPLMSNSTAKMNVKIIDGSLVDFAPMQAMAGYFKDKNLRLIRFDSLKNELSFTNGVLIIPAMNINSSLGYIEMSGKQSLDLTMEYYVRVPMKMVTQVGFNSLFDRKSEAEVDKAQIDEIEYSDKDRKIRFVNVKVVGKPDDFKVSLGRNKSKTKI
jgi:AsmA-like C-terminal region